MLVRAGVALGVGLLVVIGWSAAASATSRSAGDLPTDLTGGVSGIVDPVVAGLPPVPPPPPVTLPPTPTLTVPTPPTIPVPSLPPVQQVVDQVSDGAPDALPPGVPPVQLPGVGAPDLPVGTPELPVDPANPVVPSIPDEGSSTPPGMPGDGPLGSTDVPDGISGPATDDPPATSGAGDGAASDLLSTPAPMVATTGPAVLVGVRSTLDRLNADAATSTALLQPSEPAIAPGPTGESDRGPSDPGSLPACGSAGSVDRPSTGGSPPVILNPGAAPPGARARTAVLDDSDGCSSLARARPPVAPD
jgi:hypothetical protein